MQPDLWLLEFNLIILQKSCVKYIVYILLSWFLESGHSPIEQPNLCDTLSVESHFNLRYISDTLVLYIQLVGYLGKLLSFIFFSYEAALSSNSVGYLCKLLSSIFFIYEAALSSNSGHKFHQFFHPHHHKNVSTESFLV